MKVYIPFNSNDFNSVFSTLSISPNSFYSIRKYSFKRNTTSLLNNNDDFLLCFTNPIFHNREFDNDFGYPILLEINVDSFDRHIYEINSTIKYFLIDKTFFLTSEFKLLFRSDKEMNETFAKSLKSLESKYVLLAKSNSELVNEDFFVNEIPKFQYPDRVKVLNDDIFKKERFLNKIWGTVLGSAIASNNSISKEWQEIINQIRILNNTLSLYLNKIGENNDYEKGQTKEILFKISQLFQNIQNLEEAILLDSKSNITSEVLNTFKGLSIMGISVFKLLQEGLLASSGVELPIPLKIEKLSRSINSKYSSKYPSSYIERVNEAYLSLVESIELEVIYFRKSNLLEASNLVRFEIFDLDVSINIPTDLNVLEAEYFKQTLSFFVQTDTILDIEYFFSNKEEILINLANHFKSNLKSFTNESKERQYLLELLRSFSSLRGGFQISQINNEVLKSIAILFTSGRDFLRFVENNEKEQISNPIIYFSIWGAIYGASVFPKTFTELISENATNMKIVISEFDKIVDSIYRLEMSNEQISKVTYNENSPSFEKNREVLGLQTLSSPKNIFKDDDYALLVSLVLQLVQTNGKMKLKEIKSSNSKFESEDVIAGIIQNELSQQIILKTERKIKYAIIK
jgi:hypothetical protein